MNHCPTTVNQLLLVSALGIAWVWHVGPLASTGLVAGEPPVARTRHETTNHAQVMTWQQVSATEQTRTPVDQAWFESSEPANGDVNPLQAAFGCDAMPRGNSCDCGRCRRANCNSGFWIRGEYLLWSLDGIELPSLVTTSPIGTLPENTGVIGQSGTSVLYGNDSVLNSFRSGARVTLGWADDACGNGFEVSAMGIFKDRETFRDDRSLLARPVFDTASGVESSMLVAHPDFLLGSVDVETSSELMAFDITRRQMLSCCQGQRIDFLFGYRHGRLDETFRVNQSSIYTAARGQILSGTTVSLFDAFSAENRFHGAQFGLQFQQRSGPTTLNAIAKLGVGMNRARMTIDGQTTNTVPGGGSSAFAGGLLAQTTNIGTHEESSFTVLPEIGLTLTTYVDRDLQLTLGYSLMHWADAVRVSDAIDRNVSQFPPEPVSDTRQPAYEFRTSGILAHGLNVGAVYSF